MPRVETLLLDAGGVLLDLDYAFLRRLLEARGCLAAPEALSEAEAQARRSIHDRVANGGRVGEAWRDYFRILLNRVGLAPESAEEVIDTLWEAHQRFGLWTRAIPESVETVRALKARGYRIGVVSNAEGRVEQDLYAAGFDGLLDAVVDSHVVGVEKPDPAIFRIALERMGASAETAIFLGDVPSVDVEGARAAGITPLLLDRHGIYDDAGVPTFRSITELPGWLGE